MNLEDLTELLVKKYFARDSQHEPDSSYLLALALVALANEIRMLRIQLARQKPQM